MLVAEKLNKIDYVKIAITVALSIYFFWAAFKPSWHFIDNVNLIFHEAGHFIFFFFGNFMSIAGGTIVQLTIPAVCSLYFFRQKQYYSAALLLFWLGENFINISIYAADAQTMQLPLLGGDSTIHDWNEMLGMLNLLSETALVAGIIQFLGILITAAAIVFSLVAVFHKKSSLLTKYDIDDIK